MNTAAEEAGLEVKVPTDLEVATAIPIPSGIGSVSSQYSALLVFLYCFWISTKVKS